MSWEAPLSSINFRLVGRMRGGISGATGGACAAFFMDCRSHKVDDAFPALGVTIDPIGAGGVPYYNPTCFVLLDFGHLSASDGLAPVVIGSELGEGVIPVGILRPVMRWTVIGWAVGGCNDDLG